ncbi:glycosyltransferase, partial [Clostridium tarantellae]
GLNNISCVLEEILKNKNNLNITVVCGNNKDLKKHLEKTYNKIHNNKFINIIGYTTEISKIMEKSDLLISKPGGLTSSEALMTALPMLVPFIIPGQETENIDFLCKNNCAVYVKNLKHINNKITHLINNPNILKNMKLSAIKLAENFSKDNIVELCNNILSNR